MHERYTIHHPERIFSPGLVVFSEVLDHNLNEMVKIAGGVERLRPHCKTHKMPAVVERQLAMGITKHKAATLAEAEMLAIVGVKDILLAYNIVGPNVERCVRFCEGFPNVKFMVTADNEAALRQLSDAMSTANQTIGVMLDINPGRDRTGLEPDADAAKLWALMHELPGVTAEGLHYYDGHRHEHEFAERQAAVQPGWLRLMAFCDDLEKVGQPVPTIVCGGTPTFPVYAAMDDPRIELSPGTCVFHDVGYGTNFPDLDGFIPAALLLTRVISRPTANRVTFDLGTKAVASDPPMGQRAFLPDLPNGEQVLQNEEHLVVETDEADQFQPGDWTLAIPRHVCPCAVLHQQATVIENGEIVDHWEIVARDRQLTI